MPIASGFLSRFRLCLPAQPSCPAQHQLHLLSPGCPGLAHCSCPHSTAAVGQHPKLVGTAAPATANLLPADLPAACAFVRLVFIFKRPPKGTPGQVKEPTPRELQKMKCQWQRHAAVQGRDARGRMGRSSDMRGQGLRKSTSSCWQPENPSALLSMLPTYPGLSLST